MATDSARAMPAVSQRALLATEYLPGIGHHHANKGVMKVLSDIVRVTLHYFCRGILPAGLLWGLLPCSTSIQPTAVWFL